MTGAGDVSLLQITDLHLLPAGGAALLGVDTAESLDAVLRGALSTRIPDALLVTGDIAHTGSDRAYQRAREAIAARYRGPSLWLAGNHDLMLPLATQRPRDVELVLSDNWHVIAIDTHVDGAEGGVVADAELERLRRCLSRMDAPFAVVAGHHPLVPLGTPWLDSGCVANGAEVLELLVGDGRVKAYVCGHVHMETSRVHRGIQMLTTPSTCFQFVADSLRFTVDTTPPGWRWLDLAADGTLSTRVGRASDFSISLDLSSYKTHR